jgi:heme oxygenase (mycobilin-producing)
VILAISRFRVANGMEPAVAEALRDRPHLVDHAPGFLGMQVFVALDDPCMFSIETRWTDMESFRAWHSSEAHSDSHRSIPKGLRLDAAYTKLTFLREITPDPDWTELFHQYAQSSAMVHLLIADSGGTIQACNTAMAELLDLPEEEIRGHIVWESMTEPDALRLREWVTGGPRTQPVSMLLNFVSAGNTPRTLECVVSVQTGAFAVIGNIPDPQDLTLQTQLIAINAELSVLTREHARQYKDLSAKKLALEQTLHDLSTLYWRVRKIREVLPMCLKCGKVQSDETRWDDLADFMTERFPFLSHGYCPDCAAPQIEQGEETGPAA